MPKSIELPVAYQSSKLRSFLIPKEHLLQRLVAAVNVSLPIDHPTRIHGEKSKEIVSCLATNAFGNIFPRGFTLKSQGRLGLSFDELSGELNQESAIDLIHLFIYSPIGTFSANIKVIIEPSVGSTPGEAI